ncbi:MAG: AmmeMemoRadiSam system protein B [Parcubacteria group bacterium]|nr:AmmeMemoRadiSam system protein B [Parcubacteria group bacterium]
MYLRLPQFAGTFYPDNPQVLQKMIEDFLLQATVERFKVQPRALIVPHAGYIYSGAVAAYGFKILENYHYEKIVLLGPSHHFSFDGLALSPQGIWETPLGKIEALGKEDLKNLKSNKEIIESLEIHEPEHCLEVELPYLQVVLKNFKIISFLTGEINLKQTADIIDTLLDETTLLIISSDLSHYHSYHEAQQLDKVTIDAILDNDIKRLEEYGEACGKTAIEILIEIAQKEKWQSKLLRALNSGDVTGDKGQVVGYASIGYYSSLNSST